VNSKPSDPQADELEPHARGVATRVGVALAVLVAVVTALLPVPEGLTPGGKNLVGVFVVALILWVTEGIPIAVTSLLVIVLQWLLQIAPPPAAIAGFMTPVFFFVLTMFCIAEVDSRRVVLAFMVGTATVSTIMSDVPAAAIWMSMALPLLVRIKAVPGQSAFGKALMIGIPFASFIGGVATPAGSSINILAIFQIEQFGHARVSFLQWMGLGVPMALILTPVAWWVLMRCYPPELPTIGDPEELRQERLAMGALTTGEKKVMGLLSAMLVLWIASTWIKALDTTMVAMAGAVAMFLPGINLLTWPRAQRTIGWDALMLIGGVTSLGAAASSTGLAKYMVAALPDMQLWPVAAVIAVVSTIVGVLIPPIALLASATGQSPALYALPVAFTASCAMLLPLDAVAVITYSKGYYRMTDMLLPGAIISVAWVILMTALMVWVAPMLGLL
jgi:sodium-dependent dicarboxylate transporter 2/3/5